MVDVLSQRRVVVNKPEEADSVMERLNELLDVYDLISLADLYLLVGITPSYTDYKYGWTVLTGAQILYSKGEYSFSLPPLQVL